MFKPLLAVLPWDAWTALALSIIVMGYVGFYLRKQKESLEAYTSWHVVVPILIGGICWAYLLRAMLKL